MGEPTIQVNLLIQVVILLTAIAGVITSYINHKKIVDLNIHVNSRLSELIEVNNRASRLEGHLEGKAEGKKEANEQPT